MKREQTMTFVGNQIESRHRWLRLTPAYGVRIVREILAERKKAVRLLDPFSGTATTPLVGAQMGHAAIGTDINPFLVWLGNVKCRSYNPSELAKAEKQFQSLMDNGKKRALSREHWAPAIHNIDRWWDPKTVNCLASLRESIIETVANPEIRDLFEVAFCRTLISLSNAAFNHQSMSFRAQTGEQLSAAKVWARVSGTFREDVLLVLQDASTPVPGTAMVKLSDARALPSDIEDFDLIITSPPYVNRMSYIRELRPYMYWLKYLSDPSDAGTLDWRAIGGTWGTATSKLQQWNPSRELAIDRDLRSVVQKIAVGHPTNGKLLAKYVEKYFEDMSVHFAEAFRSLKKGGDATYIVGNSSFYGTLVPAEEWYSDLLKSTGFRNVKIETIRKRNSNKSLFEFAVTGIK